MEKNFNSAGKIITNTLSIGSAALDATKGTIGLINSIKKKTPVERNPLINTKLYFLVEYGYNYGPNYNKLEIQFAKRELSISKDSDINKTKIIGKNNPIYDYSGGTAKQLKLELSFISDEKDADRLDVLNKCLWLESLTYGTITNPQPRVKLIWGEVFDKMYWVVTSVNYKLSNFFYGVDADTATHHKYSRFSVIPHVFRKNTKFTYKDYPKSVHMPQQADVDITLALAVEISDGKLLSNWKSNKNNFTEEPINF